MLALFAFVTFEHVQVLGCMSRRGQRYGAISTFFNTYLLHVPLTRAGEVLLEISAAIPHDAASSANQLSVAEVTHHIVAFTHAWSEPPACLAQLFFTVCVSKVPCLLTSGASCIHSTSKETSR